MGVLNEATRAFGSGLVGGLAHELPAGTVLGDWRIEARIGEGGMGTVYAAVHEVIGKRAAIKVIRAEICAHPGAADRFVQEARIVNQIGHRNIVDVFHIGQLDDGRPYFVMELLVGATLGERLDGGRIPALEAIEILLQICAALEATHARGVVHRDLKPDNVILAQVHGSTVVKLVDWGIAKMRDPAARPEASAPGTMIGTPRYIAPEQARGKHVDGRTDVYSLGAIAYEMFLESPPFTADNVADLLAAHLREQAPPPHEIWPDIPDDLDRLLVGMLAKDPAARPPIDEITAVLIRTRVELLRRAGHVDGLGEAPPAVANLAIPVSEWSHEPFDRSDPKALLDTHDLGTPAPSSRRGAAVAGLSIAGALALVAGFAYVLRSERPLPAVAAAELTTLRPERVLASSRPQPSVLDVRVRPAGAQVTIDGIGLAPEGDRLARTVTPGVHEVEIRAEGYLPYRRTLEVASGTFTLAVDLEPAAETVAPARRQARRSRSVTVDPDATIDPFR